MTLKLGRNPSAKPVTFALSRYVDVEAVLPTPPARFGHEALVPSWGMLGNDTVGDCVFAGAAHETMLWNACAGVTVPFTDASVIAEYSAVTGYDPRDPSTDQGADMQQVASYRRKTGLLDANGKRHKIGAYLAITPGNVDEHLVAAYIFGAIGIGINFPAFAMDEFNAGKPWTLARRRRQTEGGHYIPVVGHGAGDYLKTVTWARLQLMSRAFFRKYNDESIAYVSLEALTGGVSLEGFNAAQLQADLNQLR